MRKIIMIAWTDMRAEFSERSTLLYFFLLPMVFMVALSLAFGTDEDAVVLPLILVDEDRSPLSGLVVTHLATQPDLRLIQAADRAEGERRFEAGEAPMMVVLPQGLTDRLWTGTPAEIGVRVDEEDTRTIALEQALRASLAVAVQTAEVAALGREIAQEEGIPLDEGRMVSAIRAGLAQPRVRVRTTVAGTALPNMLNARQQSLAGQLVTWGLITLLGASTVLLHDRETGTLARLLGTPTPRPFILLGKLVSRFLMGVVQFTVLIGFGRLALGVELGRSLLALAMTLVAFAVMGISLGVFLATLIRTSQAAAALSTFLSMVLAALGGAWWPLEITPETYQRVAQVLPTTWTMRAFKDIFLRGGGVSEVLVEIGVLLGYAAVFLTIAMWQLRELEENVS